MDQSNPINRLQRTEHNPYHLPFFIAAVKSFGLASIQRYRCSELPLAFDLSARRDCLELTLTRRRIGDHVELSNNQFNNPDENVVMVKSKP
jgi:hypothetical protein